MIKITKPDLFNPEYYFNHYLKCAPKADLEKSLNYTESQLIDYIGNLSENDGRYAYTDGKWTIKQVLQHINDTERILSYRAFRISRKDTINLSGFDENEFARNDYSDVLSLEQIKEEFIAIRKSTKLLFSKMNDEVLDFEGQASNLRINPRAIGWIMSGHSYHHLNVLNDRYVQ